MAVTVASIKARYPSLVSKLSDVPAGTRDAFIQMLLDEATDPYSGLSKSFWINFYDRAVTLTVASKIYNEVAASQSTSGVNDGKVEASRNVQGEYSVSYSAYIPKTLDESVSNQFDVELEKLRNQIAVPFMVRPEFDNLSYLTATREEPIQIPPSDTSGTIISAFSYGDANPALICTMEANRTIFTAQIVIQTAFNGTPSQISLGILTDFELLIPSSQVNPSFAAEYETNPGITFGVPTEIYLKIILGSGVTQGSGYVIITV